VADNLPVAYTTERPIGWRAWQVTFKSDTIVLRGARSVEWETSRLTAQCLAYRGEDPRRLDHPCPSDPVEPPQQNTVRGVPVPAPSPDYHPQPGCGIYALKDEFFGSFQYASASAYMFQVHGFVELGGRIMQYQYGYRAQQARMLPPLTLEVPCTSGTGTYIHAVMRCAQPATIVTITGGRGGRCEKHPADAKTEVMPVDEFSAPLITALQERYQLEVRAAWHQ
jgi:hypothetical protein